MSKVTKPIKHSASLSKQTLIEDPKIKKTMLIGEKGVSIIKAPPLSAKTTSVMDSEVIKKRGISFN